MNKFMFHLIPSFYLNTLLSFGVLFLVIELLLFISGIRSCKWKYFFRTLPFFSSLVSFYVFKLSHTAFFRHLRIEDLEKGSRVLGISAMIRNGLPKAELVFTSHHGKGYSFTLFDWFAEKWTFLWVTFSVVLMLFSTVKLSRFVFLCLKERQIKRWNLKPYFNSNLSDHLIQKLSAKKILLYTSHEIQIPLLYSYFQPKIILPHGIDKILSTHELEAVLLHELAHHNFVDQIFFPILMLLSRLFFLPIKHLELSREMKCDEFAIKKMAKKTDLITSIKKIALSFPKACPSIKCHFIHPSQIISRVRSIPKLKTHQANRWIDRSLFLVWVYLFLFVCRTQIAFF